MSRIKMLCNKITSLRDIFEMHVTFSFLPVQECIRFYFLSNRRRKHHYVTSDVTELHYLFNELWCLFTCKTPLHLRGNYSANVKQSSFSNTDAQRKNPQLMWSSNSDYEINLKENYKYKALGLWKTFSGTHAHIEKLFKAADWCECLLLFCRILILLTSFKMTFPLRFLRSRSHSNAQDNLWQVLAHLLVSLP